MTTATTPSPTTPSPTTPSRDDAGTAGAARRCAGCAIMFLPTGRQVHCSTACRKRVFRARRAARAVADMAATPAAGTRREYTVYECPDCAARRLGIQRCEECGRFGRPIGLGGACPDCGEPITLAELGLDTKPASGAAR